MMLKISVDMLHSSGGRRGGPLSIVGVVHGDDVFFFFFFFVSQDLVNNL
jgi:hypothetical protein